MKIDASSLMQMRASILQQNSALQKASAGSNAVDGLGGVAGPGGSVAGTGKPDFGTAMKDAIGQVNAMQSQSAAAAESYDKGETTDIAAVMLAREKASVGFQATLQVRNKLLSAYKDIMSMPV
ncbi:flagellar hook-basal body complex protein FliE [Sphingomonas montana]|uniref:flagellar hook-basal body complex protein FliE n=1 Tax=Sphingomonas montana TaxID=1843236 RepID=UPI00096E4282|nr:flagellar hook-basal body complex protein FliE [Sphingomonas montana]